MRPRLMSLFITVSLALTAVGCGLLQTAAPTPNAAQATAADGTRIAVKIATIEAHTYQPPHSGPLATPLPLSAFPGSTDPHACGDWSREDTGVVNKAIAAKWGFVIGCTLLDDQWIISAIPTGSPPGTGVIAIYRCDPSDAQCLDGRTPHPVSGWKYYVPPKAGYTEITRELSPTLEYIGLDICFDLAIDEYETCPR